MEKEAGNMGSVKDISEPISYFLAGSLLISTIIFSKPASGVIEPMSWFTCIVGALLIVAGFISLVIIPLNKHIASSKRVLVSKIKNYIGAVVFAITLAALGISVISLHDYQPLFIISVVFLSIVILMVIITSWSIIFRNVVLLLTLTISLNVVAITILFAGANNIQMAIVLSLSLVFLLLALNRIAQRTTS